MFTQQKLLFQFTKVIALVILFCFTFSYQAQGDEAVQEKAKDVAVITAQPDTEDLKEGFRAYIEEKLVALEREFKKPNPRFDKMAELLGDNAVLATPQGERLHGKDSLERFWRKQKDRGVTEVDYTQQIHYVSIVAEPIKLDPEEDTIDAIGHAIIDYHLITVSGEGTLTNKTGTLTLNARHPQKCTWKP